jgi:hypothetical protein
MSQKKPQTQKESSKSTRTKEESLEILIQQYYQYKTDGNTLQIKRLESILKRLGWNKFR